MTRLKAASMVAAGIMRLAPIASLESQDSTLPATHDELVRAVRAHLGADRSEQAVAVLADWVVDHHSCAYCTEVLRSQGNVAMATTDEQKAMQAAFDIVEQRALAEGNGEWLVHLAAIALGSGNKDALNRGKHYLYEGYSVGNAGGQEAHATALNYFVEMGRFEDALALVERMKEDTSLSSAELQSLDQWARHLSSEITGSELMLKPVAGTRRQDGAATEYLPIHKISPVYPAAAASAGLEGNVLVEYTVTKAGRTRDIFVVSSTYGEFEQPALDAVAEFRYLPRTVGGEAVDVAGVRSRIVFRAPVPH